MCKICLYEGSEVDNPLIAPCKCAGTMKYIHLNCLRDWLSSRKTTKVSSNTTTYIWKSLECELCKNHFPERLNCEGKHIELLEIERPNSTYIILETMSSTASKSIHVIRMANKNTIRLGRGHDSDVRITDISVSRCHAVIKLNEGNFWLEDNNSKFGTLVLIQNPIPVIYNNPISVQIGRTLLTFSVKKNWNLLQACFKPKQSKNINGITLESFTHGHQEHNIKAEENIDEDPLHNDENNDPGNDSLHETSRISSGHDDENMENGGHNEGNNENPNENIGNMSRGVEHNDQNNVSLNQRSNQYQLSKSDLEENKNIDGDSNIRNINESFNNRRKNSIKFKENDSEYDKNNNSISYKIKDEGKLMLNKNKERKGSNNSILDSLKNFETIPQNINGNGLKYQDTIYSVHREQNGNNFQTEVEEPYQRKNSDNHQKYDNNE